MFMLTGVQEGESALMKASAGGHFSIIQLIIAHRAILDLKSKVRGKRWLHACCRKQTQTAPDKLEDSVGSSDVE